MFPIETNKEYSTKTQTPISTPPPVRGIDHSIGEGGFYARITYQDVTYPWRYAFVQTARVPNGNFDGVTGGDIDNIGNSMGEYSLFHNDNTGGPTSQLSSGRVLYWASEIDYHCSVPIGTIVWIRHGEIYVDGENNPTKDYTFQWYGPRWAKIGEQQDAPDEDKYKWVEQYRIYNAWRDTPLSSTTNVGHADRDFDYAREVNGNEFVPNGILVRVYRSIPYEYNQDNSIYSQEWLFEFYGEAREFRSTLSYDMAAADSIGQICESNMRPIDNGSNLSYYPSCVQNGAGFTGSTGDVIVMHTTPFPQQYATADDPTGLTCLRAWKIISIEHAGSGSGNPIKYGYICNSDPGNGEDSYGGDACLRRLVQPTDTLAHAIQNVGCVGSYICVQAICVPGKWVRLFPKCSPCAAYAVAYQKCGSDYNIVSEHHDEQYSAVKFLVDCTQPVPRGWVDVTQSICGAFPVARTPVGFPPCFIQGDHHTHSTHNIVDYGCGTAWGGCECVVTSVWGSVVCQSTMIIGLDHNHSEAVPCGQNPGPIGSETYCSTGLCSVAGGNTCGVLSPNHFKTQVLVRRS